MAQVADDLDLNFGFEDFDIVVVVGEADGGGRSSGGWCGWTVIGEMGNAVEEVRDEGHDGA